jgi:alpha-tubulin suppressor-like RCC1 family protein
LIDAGEAYCWGENTMGQLGDGTKTSSNVPVRSAGNLTFTSIDAGAFHTCGVTTAGEAHCWGSNAADNLDGYALGGPTAEMCDNPDAPYRGDTWPCSPTPIAVSGGLSFRSITAGVWATCGIAVSGETYCWGWNQFNELGNGTDVDATAPTLVAGGLSFDDVDFGAVHACGLIGQDAYCWGGAVPAYYGYLGTGTFDPSSTPAAVVGGLHFSTLAPSGGNNIYSFTCGLTLEGAAYCWGASRAGALGTGTTDDAATPVLVVLP